MRRMGTAWVCLPDMCLCGAREMQFGTVGASGPRNNGHTQRNTHACGPEKGISSACDGLKR